MKSIRLLAAASAALAITFVACNDPVEASSSNPQRLYGPAQQVGNGTVRTYVTLDPNDKNVPLEVGVAMSETAARENQNR